MSGEIRGGVWGVERTATRGKGPLAGVAGETACPTEVGAQVAQAARFAGPFRISPATRFFSAAHGRGSI